MQHFSEIPNYPPPIPPYSEPPQFRRIFEPVSVLPHLAISSARPQAAALRDVSKVEHARVLFGSSRVLAPNDARILPRVAHKL